MGDCIRSYLRLPPACGVCVCVRFDRIPALRNRSVLAPEKRREEEQNSSVRLTRWCLGLTWRMCVGRAVSAVGVSVWAQAPVCPCLLVLFLCFDTYLYVCVYVCVCVCVCVCVALLSFLCLYLPCVSKW